MLLLLSTSRWGTCGASILTPFLDVPIQRFKIEEIKSCTPELVQEHSELLRTHAKCRCLLGFDKALCFFGQLILGNIYLLTKAI